MSGYQSNFYELGLVDVDGKLTGITVKLPRVTSILDVLPKNLSWWGYKLGVKGALAMAERGEFDLSAGSKWHGLREAEIDAVTDAVYDQLKAEKLYTPGSELARASSRGTDVHDIAESFFRDQRVPLPDEVPEEQQGYVASLFRWWQNMQPVEVLHSEVKLFSLLHRYAGTCDLILRRGPSPEKFPSRQHYYVVDFKTSKGIYESALLQVAAYAYAAVELGFIPEGADISPLVVRLSADGTPEVAESKCSIDDFLAVKETWARLERIKEELRDGKRDRKNRVAGSTNGAQASGGGDAGGTPVPQETAGVAAEPGR